MTSFADYALAARRHAAAVVPWLLLSMCAGCVTLDAWTLKRDCPPTGQVREIAATWDKSIHFVPDPTHGGTPNAGLAGRLYLFGGDGASPLSGDGSLFVELYDDTPLNSGGQPKLREQWHIDKDTLKRLLRKDTIGWGYTLFLPWGTYNREITQVHLMVRYTAQSGAPLFVPSQTMSLAQPESGGTETAGQGSPAALQRTSARQ